MASSSFILFLLSQLSLQYTISLHVQAQAVKPDPEKCAPSYCPNVSTAIQFPFSNITNKECGLYYISCNNNPSYLKIKFEEKGKTFVVKTISYEGKQMVIQDDRLLKIERPDDVCNNLYNYTIPTSPHLSFQLEAFNYTFLRCKRGHYTPPPVILQPYNYTECQDHILYYSKDKRLKELQHNCDVVEYPLSDAQVDPYGSKQDLLPLFLAAGFGLKWKLTDDCEECHTKRRGFCKLPDTDGKFFCYVGKSTDKKKKVGIFVGASLGLIVLAASIAGFLWFHKKHCGSNSSKLLSHTISSDPSLNPDIEKSNSFGLTTQCFEYKELDEATNNFDPSKELGDGGFGVVYHGILRDGRNVAVKRLYENNCRCVDQFKNEIKILSGLRHQNLVSLYGYSSRHNRELLLVYEYIPKGTLADHLHGDRAKPGAFTWATRMSIAIETADALKYLHAVGIVHRDVKTNNILLDNNFCVKVADFGLSRLFPTSVSHISTAPQGTPGYVDPDYYRCYQLTNKSDVYSFGVVLAELISSKPAVDITRHRQDINLAKMVISRIHSGALNELVDPSLGFDSDYRVNRMITSVAELTFRCLQDEKETRPTMSEVWEALVGLASEEYRTERVGEVINSAEDEEPLKKMPPLSPNSVTEAWESRTTTPNSSK